ncbi:PolyADP-ribose polymerase [Senna tora]|uniref:PolyADP-ribose polymerase n=1 Tax=Senna tora TaxID=362788 RepID=A0A834W572_9FABA|nr:PolyADP-ribose polymerase [Senna tora]
MASAWVKSLQCKSRAFEDVYHPNAKILIPSASCRKTAQNINDVVVDNTRKPRPRPMTKPKPKPRNMPEPESSPLNPAAVNRSRGGGGGACTRPAARAVDALFPALTELPEGHPSRNVVEIIFHTSWGPKAFSGRMEMIFKVQNGSKTVSRFEEYRESVKARARAGSTTAATEGSNWEENARCAADGNEVMRFHCLGPTLGGGAYDACGSGGGGGWSFHGGKGSAICTFSGSGGAHESSGGGRGRKAMLVCRVIAGRVSEQVGFMDSLLDGRVGYDSIDNYLLDLPTMMKSYIGEL